MRALNILLVDDDQNLITTLSHGLRKAMGNAISVTVCFNSYEASSMLAARIFDVVISDFDIPGKSGLELLRSIGPEPVETIRVLITAFASDSLEKEAQGHGIGYISKPFELPLLVQFIQGLIRDEESTAGLEESPRTLDPISRGNAELGRLVGRVFTNPGVPKS